MCYNQHWIYIKAGPNSSPKVYNTEYIVTVAQPVSKLTTTVK